VRAHKADLAFAFDGDTDRIGPWMKWRRDLRRLAAIDLRAQILTGNRGYRYARSEVLALLYDELKPLGGNPIMYKTGHSLIQRR